LWRANTCVKWAAILKGVWLAGWASGGGFPVFGGVCVLPLQQSKLPERFRLQPKQNECASIYLRGSRVFKPLKCF